MSSFVLMEYDSFLPLATINGPSAPESAGGFWIEAQDEQEFQEGAMAYHHLFELPLGIQLVNPQFHDGYQLPGADPMEGFLTAPAPAEGYDTGPGLVFENYLPDYDSWDTLPTPTYLDDGTITPWPWGDCMHQLPGPLEYLDPVEYFIEGQSNEGEVLEPVEFMHLPTGPAIWGENTWAQDQGEEDPCFCVACRRSFL